MCVPNDAKGAPSRSADRFASTEVRSDQRRETGRPRVNPREPSRGPAPGPTEALLRSTHRSGRPKNHLFQRVGLPLPRRVDSAGFPQKSSTQQSSADCLPAQAILAGLTYLRYSTGRAFSFPRRFRQEQPSCSPVTRRQRRQQERAIPRHPAQWKGNFPTRQAIPVSLSRTCGRRGVSLLGTWPAERR